ncbi:hypothetical protein FHG87_013910 [Trinorchestia longiramus]|nr:hypothetical protein FHG87_013910 [Trinorchestia longiramus]
MTTKMCCLCPVYSGHQLRYYHQLGRLVSESACERKDPGSNPATDMVDSARNTAWDFGKQPNNNRSNYPTQEWASSAHCSHSVPKAHCFHLIVALLNPIHDHIPDHIPDHISDHILDPIFDHILDHYF